MLFFSSNKSSCGKHLEQHISLEHPVRGWQGEKAVQFLSRLAIEIYAIFYLPYIHLPYFIILFVLQNNVTAGIERLLEEKIVKWKSILCMWTMFSIKCSLLRQVFFILDINAMHRIACFLSNTELVFAEAWNPFLDKWVLYEESQS